MSDTLVLLYQTTQHHTPEDSNLQKNVRSHKMHKFPPRCTSSKEESLSKGMHHVKLHLELLVN